MFIQVSLGAEVAVGSGDPNSWLHVHIASTLLPEPSPKPPFPDFKCLEGKVSDSSCFYSWHKDLVSYWQENTQLKKNIIQLCLVTLYYVFKKQLECVILFSRFFFVCFSKSKVLLCGSGLNLFIFLLSAGITGMSHSAQSYFLVFDL